MLFGKKRSLYGRLIFLALVVVPVVIWLVATGVGTHFSTAGNILKSIGKACAFMGFAAYCLQPVLSMRFFIVEKLFGGLDSVYLLHKQAGKLAFYLICIHPILLAAGGLLNGVGFLGIWNWESASVLIGVFALVCLILLTGFTVYVHTKHQKWVYVHRLFGWLLPVIVLHALLANAQITHIIPLYIYMLLLAEIGFVSFLIRSVFGIFIHRYRYVVAEVLTVTPAVTELVLKPTGIPMNYTPGQFAYLTLKSKVVDSEPHPYSFTTANNGPYIRFAIKNLGDDSAKMKYITPGTPALLEGPYGTFSLHNSKRAQQIWIAGGVGITPFLAMARSLKPGDKHHIHLFYAADKLDDAVFMRELIAIRKMLPDNFEFNLVNKQWSGFVTADVVGKSIKNFAEADYFICGPPGMTAALKKGLTAKGVSEEHIFNENFSVM